MRLAAGRARPNPLRTSSPPLATTYVGSYGFPTYASASVPSPRTRSRTSDSVARRTQVIGVPVAERRRHRAARRPQGHREGRAASELALDTHLTAVHLDERLGHGEAEAQAAPLELEQPGGVSGDVEGREERLEHARAAGRVDSG